LNFVFTIIATFFGVFLAIYMNNYSIQEQNINTTIKLLDASVNEIELVVTEAEIKKDYILNADILKQKLAENKFPYPSIFPRIMKNDMVLKNISSNPWEELSNSYKVGDVVDASISRITSYGIFATLGGGIEGMVPLTSIPEDKQLSVGQTIKVNIEALDKDKRRLDLNYAS